MAFRDELIAIDRKHLWRPYTSSEDHLAKDPLVIVGSEGSHLIGEDGQRYLDGMGSWWSNNLGYQNPRLLAALKKQAESLPHVALGGCTHEPGVRLAESLSKVAPAGLERVFFSDNGSTSVEIALKMAFQYWQQNGRPERKRFLCLPGAYHGDTFGAMSVGSLDEFGACFRPLLFQVNDKPAPKDAAGWEKVIGELVATLKTEGDSIAGVIVEPLILGAAGMRMYAPELLKALRDACDEADTFLIADEVFTGLGRTGLMWACDHAGISPDLLCVAKGLSGGLLPFSATLANERVYEGFKGDSTRAFLHGHTFCGNPLGAAVALEVLAIYREEDILAKTAKKAVRIAEAFEALGDIEGIKRSRSLGMIGACDLGDGGYHSGKGWQVSAIAKSHGVSLRPLGDVIYIVPPLTISDEDLETLLSVMRGSIEEALAK